METNKKVSIVIPVYKAADTITRCVESLEKNTYQNGDEITVNARVYSKYISKSSDYLSRRLFRRSDNRGMQKISR